MELSPSKRRILEASLELFSVYGYEAASVGQIADAAGIRKASLYSHFKSKQEILDVLIVEMTERYEANSLFAKPDRDGSPEDCCPGPALSCDDIIRQVKDQISFLIHDRYISMTRKLLTIEQFRNPELAALQSKRAYTDILRYYQGLMDRLVQNGFLAEGDTELMALQFFSPISLQLYRVDREPACEADAFDIIERHIRQFIGIYAASGKELIYEQHD